MSDARERLLGKGMDLIVCRDGGSEIVTYHDARNALDAFLCCPDDLLAVLVEAGVLEWDGPHWLEVVARRTDGSTR